MKDNDFRSKRETFVSEIRRNNREEIFAKKRNTGLTQETTEGQTQLMPPHIVDERFREQILEYQSRVFKPENLLEFLQNVHDPDPAKQHYGLIGIRKLLCLKHNPPVQQVIDAGLVLKLMDYARQTHYPQLQLESTWCLANIAAGTNVGNTSIIEKGGTKLFIDLLLSEHIGIVEQAIWAVGNIACDLPAYRDSIIRYGGVKNLVKVVETTCTQLQKSPGRKQIVKSACWSLSNLCRSQPRARYSEIKQALTVFFYVIKNGLINDIDVVCDICWAISYYSDNKKEGSQKIDKIQNCINSEVVPVLINYLSDGSKDALIVPCIRTIGNIANGTPEQVRYLLSHQVMDRIQPLLSRNKKTIRRQTCWVLSNIAAGQFEEVKSVLQRNSLIDKLLQLFESDFPAIKAEICYIMTNPTEHCTSDYIMEFYMQREIIKYFANIIINETDPTLLQTALETLYFMIKLGQKYKHLTQNNRNPFVKYLLQANAVDKMEELQHHQDQKIYNAVVDIISEFFDLEDPLNL